MNRRSLVPMIAGVALALSLPGAAAFAGASSPDGTFQLAQALVAEHDHHPPPPPPPAPGGMMGMMGMAGMHGGKGPEGNGHGMNGGPEQHFLKMCETADAHHAAMLAFAEVRLKLTEAQKPAWSKFTETAKAAHQAMAKLCDLKDQPPPTTLPERLARAEHFAEAHYTHLQILLPAVTELYGQLTPEQRKIADSLPLGMGGHHGHHSPM